jgi:hypothetical protein
MPGGLNGKELATRARALRPDLKVLFTSGFPGTARSEATELDEGDVRLSKPYRRHDLAKAVHGMLPPDRRGHCRDGQEREYPDRPSDPRIAGQYSA